MIIGEFLGVFIFDMNDSIVSDMNMLLVKIELEQFELEGILQGWNVICLSFQEKRKRNRRIYSCVCSFSLSTYQSEIEMNRTSIRADPIDLFKSNVSLWNSIKK